MPNLRVQSAIKKKTTTHSHLMHYYACYFVLATMNYNCFKDFMEKRHYINKKKACMLDMYGIIIFSNPGSHDLGRISVFYIEKVAQFNSLQDLVQTVNIFTVSFLCFGSCFSICALSILLVSPLPCSHLINCATSLQEISSRGKRRAPSNFQKKFLKEKIPNLEQIFWFINERALINLLRPV